eukprot:2533181-Alexandrium_andersonii.AAC.1
MYSSTSSSLQRFAAVSCVASLRAARPPGPPPKRNHLRRAPDAPFRRVRGDGRPSGEAAQKAVANRR